MAETAVMSEMQLVVFELAEEQFGLDIATVREIIQMQPVTKIPGAEYFMEGMINLRGVVIPVVDLRKRFGLDSMEYNNDTRIMVISSGGQDIGIIVDSVEEVLRVPSDSIVPPSSVVTSAGSDYLSGIAKLSERLVILLDPERLLGGATF
jgi:purine-binding chemotaxis protein CheW